VENSGDGFSQRGFLLFEGVELFAVDVFLYRSTALFEKEESAAEERAGGGGALRNPAAHGDGLETKKKK